MSESFFDEIEELTSVLAATITVEQKFDRLKSVLADADVEREFWKRLDDPRWLNVLRRKGRFASPPSAEATSGGGIRFPNWPASKYLARMAEQAPAEVAAIFAEITTDNAAVIGDMLDAALAMPADVATSLVPAVCRAAKDGSLWIDFKDASDLCVRLAEGGQLDAAMALAEALFTPTFEEGREQPSRRDVYWYKDGLRKVVPVLATAKAREFLPRLCDWLSVSVRAKKYVEPESGSDYSYAWRPAVEEHAQNRDHDFAGVMVGSVREGAELAIRGEHLSLEAALRIVEGYPYFVFRRIRLHLIGEFADQAPDLARRTILDRELFEDHRYKHEYAMLVGRRLNLLSEARRDEWFGWIDAGPRRGDVDSNITEEVRQAQGKYWRFQKLHWVRAHLQGERRDFYEQMLTEHGEPELADLNIYSRPGRWGHDSPMTSEELSGMTFEQVVDVVSVWQPEDSRFLGPSIAGLASTFRKYVATNPEEFSAKAGVLVDRPAIFARGFISQMNEAAKAGRAIDLSAVLDLCGWIVDRPVEERTTPEQEDECLVDENWQPARHEISQLVENVCKARSGRVPRYPLDDIREPMWGLIERLCRDRAESYIVQDTANDDPRVHDYLLLGMNSPRGKAVEAAIEYARWVADHITEPDEKQEIVPGGFDAMPEVREVLERQIAPGNRSLEALSVIGARIGVINWIDKDWLAKNAAQLFQLAGIEQTPRMAQGWAAWNAFLVWVRPHIEFYRVFKSQFSYAVDQAATVELTERTREQPMYRLGEHLMILYGRGQLGLDDDGGLLRRFVENSNPEVRRHAIGFVGRSLEGDEKVPEAVVDRFKDLWDLYWVGPGKKDAEEKPDASLFGTWFSCGQFPEQWSLDCLREFVAVAPTPEPDGDIVEKLAEIAHVDLVNSVRILDTMIRGDREGWRVHCWLDSAKAILGQAMKTGGAPRTEAEALIDYLGRRGYTDFGRLLR